MTRKYHDNNPNKSYSNLTQEEKSNFWKNFIQLCKTVDHTDRIPKKQQINKNVNKGSSSD